jgi:hypothetical protein
MRICANNAPVRAASSPHMRLARGGSTLQSTPGHGPEAAQCGYRWVWTRTVGRGMVEPTEGDAGGAP